MHIRSKTGFSLIELLIVTVIIMILAGILLPALFNTRRLAKRRQTEGWRRALVTAVRNYHFMNRKWPCPNEDQGVGPDHVYSNDNWKIIQKLTNSVPPLISVGDFKRDTQGNVLDAWDECMLIQIDTDYNKDPVDGVRVRSSNPAVGWQND